jgi:hypothetical protein
MSGTPAGGKLAKQKLLAANPNHYRDLGKLGGSVKSNRKGFAQWDREVLAQFGRINGKKSAAKRWGQHDIQT